MQRNYDIVYKEQPTFYFIGVTTGSSSINKVFPLWMKELRNPEIILEGIDCKIHDEPEVYRQAVAQIKYDPNSLGALVTTHKIDLFNAAKDMFEYFDPYSEITGELSSISKNEGNLEGHAKDPITAGLSLDHIINPGYFERTGGDVLCLGAGGSAVATLLHLINKEEKSDRPDRFICINRSQPRLDHMQEMVKKLHTDIKVDAIRNNDPKVNDHYISKLPKGSIVINATGMGKDHPGSPITDNCQFPIDGIAWEFNYRGELDFMHQAIRQTETRNLHVEDGWVYFIHGWTAVIFQVLHLDMKPELFDRLDRAASTVR